jgi:pimeloyl-[acyl-carrier protein] methyl ester esterase
MRSQSAPWIFRMLHIDVSGEGPELVLLHGWGMHSGVWGEWLGDLTSCFRVTAVDLPGHGNSPYQGQRELLDWAAAVLEVTPPRAWWVGWSLGGLLALAAAEQAQDRLSGLLLLAATPRFVADCDWTSAVSAAVLEEFAQQLETEPERTLSRFLSLQVRGAEGGKEAVRQLRANLRSRPAANPAALHAGLRFLRRCDLRNVMSSLEIPLLWLLGERDTLIPASVACEFPTIRSAVIARAGHAPFLSHPRHSADYVRQQLLNRQGY